MSPKSKSPSTQAGEFVREEIHHIRQGKHGARSTEQAIAIGLSKARRAGEGRVANPKRSRAALKRLKRASKSVASHAALSRHAHKVARRKKR